MVGCDFLTLNMKKNTYKNEVIIPKYIGYYASLRAYLNGVKC